MLATGDQQGRGRRRRAILNYQYRNRFQIDDYVASAELYRASRPDLLRQRPLGPREVSDDYSTGCWTDGRRLAELHRELLPLDEVDFGAEGFAARIDAVPHDRRGAAGRSSSTVTVRNPFAARRAARRCGSSLPRGLDGRAGGRGARSSPPQAEATRAFRVTAGGPAAARAGRGRRDRRRRAASASRPRRWWTSRDRRSRAPRTASSSPRATACATARAPRRAAALTLRPARGARHASTRPTRRSRSASRAGRRRARSRRAQLDDLGARRRRRSSAATTRSTCAARSSGRAALTDVHLLGGRAALRGAADRLPAERARASARCSRRTRATPREARARARARRR